MFEKSVVGLMPLKEGSPDTPILGVAAWQLASTTRKGLPALIQRLLNG